MASTATTAALIGRDEQLREIREVIGGAPQVGAALLLRGEPGIGKSALLRAGIEHARGLAMQVLESTGLQSEAALPFAALHQLVRPILRQMEALPPPQRRALTAAFGITEEQAPDPFLIGLATLNLLADAATAAPVLIAVEDAHWLDAPSATTLAFVARRLSADPIVLLAAARDGVVIPLSQAGIRELPVGPLDDTSAEALFEAHASGIPASMRERVLAAAAGNPLALTQLPLALERFGGRADDFQRDLLPLTAHLESAYAARAEGLPIKTRTLLLVAAVNDSDTVLEALAAASLIAGEAVTADSFAPAEAAALVDLEGARVRFRHPLVRSAIYQSAAVSQRRPVHEALATVLEGEPDRRAWHRAAALIAPDDAVASDLDDAATRAERRGAVAVAAAALERAAALTGDEGQRGARLLRAIQLEFQLGHPDEVRRLMALAGALELGTHQHLTLAAYAAMFDRGVPGDPTLVRSVVATAARAKAAGDGDLALELLRVAAVRGWWTDPGDEARGALLAATSALRIVDDDQGRASARVIYGGARADSTSISILAFAEPLRHGAVVIEAIERIAPQLAQDPMSLRRLAQSAQVVGDFGRAALLYAGTVSGLRAQGRLGFLASALASQARISIELGDWGTAVPAAEEAARLAEETRQPVWVASARASQALLAGMRGDPSAAFRLAAEAESLSKVAHREGIVGDHVVISERALLATIERARGIASLLAGRHDEAYEHLRRTFEPSDPAFHLMTRWWGLDHLADAASGTAHRAEAYAILAQLEPLAALTPASGIRLAVEYARAVLADDTNAEARYLAALDADLAHWPLMRARLSLAYGTWLRRQRRSSEARAPLRSARDAFDAIGAAPWAERANAELRAAGESSQRRRAEAVDQLTPQELQIAQLAAEGLSNRDIGQRLYLSHRTIGSHLYRIFPKLGITSRAQLRAVIGQSAMPAMQLSPERA